MSHFEKRRPLTSTTEQPAFTPSKECSMQTKSALDHSDVTRIIDAARREAVQNNWAVAIAVVDDGGHPLTLERLDGCAPVGAYVAIEKARTAALGRRESRFYEEMINGGRTAFLSVPAIGGLLEGGIPVVVEGQVVGAVGVSGVKPNQDAQVARAGVNAVAT
jgi:glc operon protein GlcG